MFEAARRNRGRTSIGLLAVVFHLSFAVLAAMPQVVFCHRADGCVAVEFSGPPGVCMCAECEHCLERLSKGRSGASPPGPSLEACHCRHDPVLIEAASLSLRRDEAGFKVGAGSLSTLPWSLLPGCGSAEGRPAPANASPPASPSFDSPLLRC